MNAPAATLIPIFATPFGAVPLTVPGAADGSLAAYLAGRATEENREPHAPREPLCYRSREVLFDLEDERIAALRGEMLAGLSAAAQASNLATPAEFGQLKLQARARLIIIRPDGYLPAATLPLASWCAIYCLAGPPAPAGRALSGVLRLYEPRLSTMFMDGANWRLRPPFASGHHIWQPVPGHMAVFPASVTHEIALNRSDRDLMLVIARVRFANPGQEVGPPW